MDELVTLLIETETIEGPVFSAIVERREAQELPAGAPALTA